MIPEKLKTKLVIGNLDHPNFDGDEVTVKNSKGEHIGIGKVKGDIIEIELSEGSSMLKASNLGIGGVITSRKENVITGFNLTEVSIIK